MCAGFVHISSWCMSIIQRWRILSIRQLIIVLLFWRWHFESICFKWEICIYYNFSNIRAAEWKIIINLVSWNGLALNTCEKQSPQPMRSWLADAHIDGLMQEWRKSIANAVELWLPCINPSICTSRPRYFDQCCLLLLSSSYLLNHFHLLFSCDQAALQMFFSVCPSVRPSVCHIFLTMF